MAVLRRKGLAIPHFQSMVAYRPAAMNVGSPAKLLMAGKPFVWYAHRCEKDACQSADIVATPSEDMAHRIRKGFSLPEKCVRVIHRGVNTDEFHPMDKKEARKRLGIGDDKIILAASRFDKQKDVKTKEYYSNPPSIFMRIEK